MDEMWKDVPQWEGYYQVSNLGRVRSVDRITNSRPACSKVLKQAVQNSGYYFVSLWKNNKSKNALVHRIVALAFIKNNDKKKKYVNHIDGNKFNNNFENLEWCTFSENIKHSYLLGIRVVSDKHINRLKKFNTQTKSKEVLQYDLNGNFIKKHLSIKSASLEVGVSGTRIGLCIGGRKEHKTAGGFIWKTLNKK